MHWSERKTAPFLIANLDLAINAWPVALMAFGKVPRMSIAESSAKPASLNKRSLFRPQLRQKSLHLTFQPNLDMASDMAKRQGGRRLRRTFIAERCEASIIPRGSTTLCATTQYSDAALVFRSSRMSGRLRLVLDIPPLHHLHGLMSIIFLHMLCFWTSNNRVNAAHLPKCQRERASQRTLLSKSLTSIYKYLDGCDSSQIH